MFFACGHISQSAVRAGNDIIAVPRGISGRNEKDELVRDRDAARDTRDIVSLREVVPGSRNRSQISSVFVVAFRSVRFGYIAVFFSSFVVARSFVSFSSLFVAFYPSFSCRMCVLYIFVVREP